MKIKEINYKFNKKYSYNWQSGGRYKISYSPKEVCELLDEIKNIIVSLKNKYKPLEIRWSLSMYGNIAYINWSREWTETERKIVMDYKKEQSKKLKNEELYLAKKLAKKYKLI